MRSTEKCEYDDCHLLIDSVNELIINYTRTLVHDRYDIKEKVLQLMDKLVGNKEKNKILTTLSQIIINYLEGKISEDAFRFYFKKQFDYDANLNNFISNLKLLISDEIVGNVKYTFSETDNPPKISIIITTYNRKDYLVEAVNSILLQDYRNLEIIIIDDNSSDGTNLLVKEYYGEDSRVTYKLKEKNCGPGNNRREAFESFADGEYVLFLDDDDYLIDKNYLSKAVKFHIDHPEVSFVAANVLLDYSLKNQLEISCLGFDEIINNREYLIQFEKENFPKPKSTLTTVFKSKSLLQMGILDMKMVNDTSIYLRSLLVGHAGFIDAIVGLYRIHNENITFNLNREFIIENIDEKKIVKNMAIEQYGYSKNEMDKWYNNNVYNTISYYLYNSANKPSDFIYMFNWVKENCPEIHKKIFRQFTMFFIKKCLVNIKVFRKVRFKELKR